MHFWILSSLTNQHFSNPWNSARVCLSWIGQFHATKTSSTLQGRSTNILHVICWGRLIALALIGSWTREWGHTAWESSEDKRISFPPNISANRKSTTHPTVESGLWPLRSWKRGRKWIYRLIFHAQRVQVIKRATAHSALPLNDNSCYNSTIVQKCSSV